MSDNSGRQNSPLQWVIAIVLLVFIGYELYSGLALKKVGIPGLFEVEFTTPEQKSGSKQIPDNKENRTIPNNLTLEITKIVALRAHCNCDNIYLTINQQFVNGSNYEMCYNDEKIVSFKQGFKNSIQLGIMVSDCGFNNPNYYGNQEIITKDAYLLGPQIIRLGAGQGLYELTYVVK